MDISFEWETDPKEWAGLTPEELVELADEAANFFNISAADQSKTHIIFGDHQSVTYSDGTVETPLARHNAIYDKNSRDYSWSKIVLNRSLELALETTGEDQDFLDKRISPEDYDHRIEDGVIVCTLRTPEEAVLWFMAEEINHAHVSAKLGNSNVKNRAKEKYEEHARRLYVDIPNKGAHEYAFDIVEITASRQVLRFLATHYKDVNPKRAKFFNEMYQLSLQKKMVAWPRTALVLDQMFIKTGYKPHEEKQ